MPEEVEFRDLIAQVRVGDGQAAEELVRRFEPAVRTVIRSRLRNSPLRRLFDSMDVCNSVLGAFLVRASSGRYELETPEQVRKLLVTIALNKLNNLARKHPTPAQGIPEGKEPADRAPSPSEAAAHQESLQRLLGLLSEEERRIADLRSLGLSWAEIATEIGGTPDSLRVRYARALNRVRRELHRED